jgi:hypothetical protein
MTRILLIRARILYLIFKLTFSSVKLTDVVLAVVVDVVVSLERTAVDSVRLFFMWWPYNSSDKDMTSSVKEFTAMSMGLKMDSKKSLTSRITKYNTKKRREKGCEYHRTVQYSTVHTVYSTV